MIGFVFFAGSISYSLPLALPPPPLGGRLK